MPVVVYAVDLYGSDHAQELSFTRTNSAAVHVTA
jgi:hypothetical protein